MHAVIAVKKQTNVELMRKSKFEDIIEKHNYFVSGTYLSFTNILFALFASDFFIYILYLL